MRDFNRAKSPPRSPATAGDGVEGVGPGECQGAAGRWPQHQVSYVKHGGAELSTEARPRPALRSVDALRVEATSPDRITLLRDNLDSMLHQELTGKTLFVTHYAIYINSSQRDRRPGLVIGGSALGSWVEAIIDSHRDRSCRAEEVDEGWLEPGDVTKSRSPVIVQITLSLDGRTHSVRSFFSPDREIPVDPGNPETTDAIFSAVKKATDQLIAELPIS